MICLIRKYVLLDVEHIKLYNFLLWSLFIYSSTIGVVVVGDAVDIREFLIE